jgi:hypothetical protein
MYQQRYFDEYGGGGDWSKELEEQQKRDGKPESDKSPDENEPKQQSDEQPGQPPAGGKP